MTKLGLWIVVLSSVALPLARSMRRRQKQSRLQSIAMAARDRATGAGESALDTLGDLAETARERIGALGDGSRRQAGTTAGSFGGLAGTAGTLLAEAPRLVAQLRGGDDDSYPYGGRDDWRKYGDVFSR